MFYYSFRSRVCGFASVVMFGSLFACSMHNQGPPVDALLRSWIDLQSTTHVEAISQIDYTSYRLIVNLERSGKWNEPSSIEISLPSDTSISFMLPDALFRSEHHIWGITNISKLDNGDIGFYLFSGSGEKSRNLFYRVNTHDCTVRKEVWGDLSGLEKVEKYQPLVRLRDRRSDANPTNR